MKTKRRGLFPDVNYFYTSPLCVFIVETPRHSPGGFQMCGLAHEREGRGGVKGARGVDITSFYHIHLRRASVTQAPHLSLEARTVCVCVCVWKCMNLRWTKKLCNRVKRRGEDIKRQRERKVKRGANEWKNI